MRSLAVAGGAMLKLPPRPVRDWLYGLIARNRYALFGQKANCDIRRRPCGAALAKILILGGYGVFGGRLAQRLARRAMRRSWLRALARQSASAVPNVWESFCSIAAAF